MPPLCDEAAAELLQVFDMVWYMEEMVEFRFDHTWIQFLEEYCMLAGDKLDLEVLLVDANGKLSVGSTATAKVQAEIVDQVKGDTVIAYKQKRRKGFHKKKGHRTAYTKIKVLSIA